MPGIIGADGAEGVAELGDQRVTDRAPARRAWPCLLRAGADVHHDSFQALTSWWTLRGAVVDAELSGWAGRRQRMRSFGSIAPLLAGDQFASVAPAQDFDGTAFARYTTRARPLGA